VVRERGVGGDLGSLVSCMTKGSILPKKEIEKLNMEKRIFYFKSLTFSNQI
jgi:hypothetical protein